MRGTQTWPPQEPPAAAGTPASGPGVHGPGPELVGYARVSTRSQNDDTQLADLTAAGCVRIFTDHGVSGKLARRPELDKAVAYMQPGDTFVITRLSRAMRSLKHLLALAEQLAERGIGLVVLKQQIDTTTPTGRLVFHILGAIDEFQRELIVEGTMEGLEAARARGHKGGMPRKLAREQEDLAIKLIGQGEHVAAVARSLKVAPATIYRVMRRRGLAGPPDGDGKGGRPPVPPETAAEVMRMLRAGESISAAADAAGLSRTTVRRIWEASGETGKPPGAGSARPGAAGGRPRGLTDEQRKQAGLLLGEGASVAATARALGVSRATIYRAMER